MLRALAIVLVLAVIGDGIADAVQAPVPGSAFGLISLACYFALCGGPDSDMARLFDGVAPHLPLFFVPAAAGIITSAELLSQAWLHIVTAITLGTAITIAATGLVAQALLCGPVEIREND